MSAPTILTTYYGIVVDGKRVGYERVGLFATLDEAEAAAAQYAPRAEILKLIVNDRDEVVGAAQV